MAIFTKASMVAEFNGCKIAVVFVKHVLVGVQLLDSQVDQKKQGITR